MTSRSALLPLTVNRNGFPYSISSGYAISSSSLNESSISFKMLNILLDHSVQIHVYVCSLLCVMGVIGNFISLLVFFRSSRHSPKITTRHSFILLSLSNLAYLIVFWYYSVMPKMTRHFKIASESLISMLISKINVINSNTYMCKSVLYSLNVFIFINALITVSFSLERAFAINFPLRARNMRSNHICLFKTMFVCIIVISFLFPIYNLVLLDIQPKFTLINGTNTTLHLCNVPDHSKKLYIDLTIFFVSSTLAIPFLVITISNVSIVVAIYRNKILLERHKKEKQIDLSPHAHNSALPQSQSNQKMRAMESSLIKLKLKDDKYAFIYRNTFVKKNWYIRSVHRKSNSYNGHTALMARHNSCLQEHGTNIHLNGVVTNGNHLLASFNSSNKSSSHNSNSLIVKNDYSLNKLYAQNKHLMVTKMLLMISSSFVMLQLPYFITWCYYVNNQLRPTNKIDRKFYTQLLMISEIPYIIYYSIASLLLFSGKQYRKHLYALFCYVARSAPAVRLLKREVNNNYSKKITIVRV